MNSETKRPRHKRRLAILATGLAITWAIGLALAPVSLAAFSPQQAAPADLSGAAATSTGHASQPPEQVRAAIVVLSTVVTAEVPTGGVLGQDVTVAAQLKTKAGQVLVGEHLTFEIDGAPLHTDRTDSAGKIAFVIPGKKLAEARAYPIVIIFSGSHGLAASSITTTLTILSAAIQIQTVPPLPNLRFSLGAETALTGPDGIAALPVPKSGTYELTADLNADTSATATVKASFVRWLDNVFTANRTIDVTGPATYTVGLKVAYRASINYVDLDNNPVDSTLVSQAQFSTGTGTNDVILNSQTGAASVWWTASSTVRVSTSLKASPTTYRALSATIHGAEVVNRGQQSWTPTENGVWTIQLLLYGMTVQTRDAVFGTPVGGQLTLMYPDGAKVQQPVDGDGKISFANLPRGQYQLQLTPSAFSPPSPVALSKVQDATLRIVTYQDIGLAVGLAVVVLVVLAIIGRWALIKAQIRRRRRRSALTPSTT
jgi:hypothetical protein